MCLNSRKLCLLAALVIAAIGCGREVVPEAIVPRNTETIFIVTDGMPSEEAAEVAQHFQHQFAESAEPGDVITVVAAPSHTHVATFVVPEGSRNTRLRNKSVRQQLPAINKLFKMKDASRGGQVQLPSIGSSIRSLRRTKFPIRVVVVGNPFYLDPRQEAWSMKYPFVPTDAAIGDPNSPFTLAAKLPAGTLVHWFETRPSADIDPAHLEAARRFNRLYIQELGGSLTSVSPDAALAFDFSAATVAETIVREPGIAGRRRSTIESTLPEEQADAPKFIVPLDKGSVASSNSLPQPPKASDKAPSSNVPALPPAEAAKKVLDAAMIDKSSTALAMSWSSDGGETNCDLDFYIRAKGYEEEIYFGNKKTTFGELYFDIQSSGSLGGENADFSTWEWASVNRPKEELTVFINTFRATKPMTVRFICVANGVRKEQTFKISPPSIWEGWLHRDRTQSTKWKKVTL
jgi:hypothetical protein